ncbi:hypothetical protein JANAI62_31450 [Jannaschia pagri]|uniref:HPt domain-containing protein n=1 Tax=Jannaschia pagri TaxID=2829797 RepID=A0ABQ4NR19_9RHOB|nr:MULTISPECIES: Hpt domain-containing protein [unclassified Jannaschia]GIT92618.1 hypothetical protein JANAI61_30760 [Jannaschia sp. AI_61]GIT96522.1 hypothetical protein JANAI62_31450 [Jannaschia sp. AI_62]
MTDTLTSLSSNRAKAEPIEFDHDVLVALCQRHGHQTEEFLAITLSQVEQLLALAKLQFNAEQISGLSRTAQDLQHVARMIGMRTLETTARAVEACAAQNDRPALAACTQRLLRLGHPESIDQWTVCHNTVA